MLISGHSRTGSSSSYQKITMVFRGEVGCSIAHSKARRNLEMSSNVVWLEQSLSTCFRKLGKDPFTLMLEPCSPNNSIAYSSGFGKGEVRRTHKDFTVP